MEPEDVTASQIDNFISTVLSEASKPKTTWDDLGAPKPEPSEQKTVMFENPTTDPPVKTLADRAKAETQAYTVTGAPQHVVDVLSTVPKAFEEPAQVSYKQDEVDAMLLNERSFISDFVNLGRGVESPTSFFTWGALWTVSTALNRNAWLNWYPDPLWPNIYVILVAPAGICRKSAAMDIGEHLLKTADQYHKNNVDAFANSVKLMNKSTPEALFNSLIPTSKTFLDVRTANPISVERTSKAALKISELGTFLGKQQYNSGLVNTLTDLYDSKFETTSNTLNRGEETIKDIYVTMISGITPTGMKESIPQEALGGGFMSRCVPVYQELPTKIFSKPIRLEGYPVPEDIGKKLAWIANNKRGEYIFSEEAESVYDEWYHLWKSSIVSATLMEHENRMDVQIRKVSMLICAAQYRPERVVQKQHVALAIRLVTYTLRKANRLVSEIGASPFVKQMDVVRGYIQKCVTVDRKKLVHRFSRDIVVDQLQLMLVHLVQSGQIKATLNDIEQQAPSSNSKELYTYVEDF